jgi:hypothetical protein
MAHSMLVFLVLSISAQVPQAIDFQGIARDTLGLPLGSQNISLRVNIFSGSPTGSIEYRETHALTTSPIGAFSIAIGSGLPVSGVFTAIQWSDTSHYLSVELDANGGVNFTAGDTAQILSVPYALESLNASHLRTDADQDGFIVGRDYDDNDPLIFNEPWQTVTIAPECDFTEAAMGAFGYRKDVLGQVHLRGQADGGTVAGCDSLVFLLPVGYRPSNTVLQPSAHPVVSGVLTNGDNGVIMIRPNGAVYCLGMAQCNFNGASFFLDE